MATPSAASQGGSGDEKPLLEGHEGPELSHPVGGISQTEATEGSQQNLPFITPEPIREDQVQNAVKFLSHPKVRGSPVIYRRSFLERKGLTKDEIDEAFLRVPDPPPNATGTDSGATNQASQPRTSTTSLQPQVPIQPPQPAAAQAGAISLAPNFQQRRFNWSYALIAIGVLSASGAGTAVLFKNMVLPRLKAWIRSVAAEGNVSEKEEKSSKSLTEETAEAAKAAASAATLVATASQELLNSKNEDRKYFEAFMGMIDVQVKEMKTMNEAIHKLGKAREQDRLIEEYVQSATANGTTNVSWGTSQQVNVSATPNADYGKALQSLTSASVEPKTAPHSKSYMEMISMAQRGEKPSNLRPWESSPQSPEAEDPLRRFPYFTGATGANESLSSQRVWVPPQPPSVAIPEAAAAIRHPKSSSLPIRKPHSDDEKVITQPHDNVISDSSGLDIELVPNNSEIEEERANDIEMD